MKHTSEYCKQLTCQNCSLRERTEWANLKEDELNLLNKHKVAKPFVSGDVLFNQQDVNSGVYCVHSGLVGLRHYDAGGNAILIKTANPGDTVGYRSFLKKSNHSISAEILSPSVICVISPSIVRQLLKKSPDLGLRFLEHSLNDLDEMEKRYIQARSWSAKSRFLHTLMVFREQESAAYAKDSMHFDLPVTRQELASMIGITPEAMSRLVRNVKDEGLVEISGRQVHIPDIDKVADQLQLAS